MRVIRVEMEGFSILLDGEHYGERYIEDGFKFLNHVTRRKMVMLTNIGTQEEQLFRERQT